MHDVGELQLAAAGSVARTGRAAQDRVHPVDDLGQRERLGHVVVAADGRTPATLSSSAVRAVRNRIGRLDAVGPQPAGDLEPIEVGKHHVEHDQVEALLLRRGKRGPPGGRASGRRSPRSAAPSTQRRRSMLVVDNEDPLNRRHVLRHLTMMSLSARRNVLDR